MPPVPNAASFNQNFPVLDSSHPQVNIPVNPPMHVQYPPNLSQPSGITLEDQIRGIRLSNDVPNQRPKHYQGPHLRSQGPPQSPARRPNQTRSWRHQAAEQNDLLQQQSQRFMNQNSKLDRRPAPSRPAHNVDGHTHHTNQARYTRPPPQHRQLYNPSNNQQSQGSQRTNVQMGSASAQSQIDYLDSIAIYEIDKAKITVQEFDEKQTFRRRLEQVCRKAIFESEKVEGANNVSIDTIELKCFGSLSTTFATKSSDMDLVLVSPQSQPVLSAPDSKVPRLVEKVLLDSGFGARLLTNARVPIIRFCEKPTKELVALLKEAREKFEVGREVMVNSSLVKELPHKRKPQKAKELSENDSSEDATENQPTATSAKETAENADTEIGEAHVDDNVASPSIAEAQSDQDAVKPVEESQNSLKTEAGDPSLETKTDAERIRLYRLAMREAWYDTAERVIISNYIKAIESRNTTDEAKSLARSRLKDLPNILGRYRPPPEAHPLEYPKTGVGIQCDIGFAHLLGLHNSDLLRCYSLCDTRVRGMVLFVKAWTKKRKINTPYHGTLSSYGYVLMVLHYLINIAQPPVLPNMQQIHHAFEDDMSRQTIELDGYNIQFFRNEDKIEALRNSKSLISPVNQESIGSLLRGFFHYYAQNGFHSPSGGFNWNMDILSLRTIGGIITKRSKSWTGAKTDKIEINAAATDRTQQPKTKDVRQRYLLAIEDPFETEHNIARTVVHNGIVAIRNEFRRAHALVEHAGMIRGIKENLFEEGEDKENLQYSAFGPRLRQGKDRGLAKKTDGGKAGASVAANQIDQSNPCVGRSGDLAMRKKAEVRHHEEVVAMMKGESKPVKERPEESLPEMHELFALD